MNRNTKRLLSLVLCLVMCFSLLPASVFAAEDEPADPPEEPEIAGQVDEVDPAEETDDREAAETAAEDPESTEPSDALTTEEASETQEETPVDPLPAETPIAVEITLVSQPQDAAPQDGTAEFAVVASVNTDAELHYQWQRLDESAGYADEAAREAAWESLPGETASELSFVGLDEEALAEAMKYAYRCVITVGEAEAITAEAHIVPPAARAKLALGNSADTIASGECGADGDNLTWSLDSDGVLTISGTGEMMTAPYPWQDIRDQIVKVYVENGVTSIGASAFGLNHAAENLTDVVISDSVTFIGASTFSGCSSLVNVILPEGLSAINAGLFSDCSSLSGLTIPSGVVSIDPHIIDGCNSLTEITIPSSVTDIDCFAFSGCDSLTSITVSEGNLSFSSYDGILYDYDKTTLLCCPGGKTTINAFPDSLTRIGHNSFYCSVGLSGIVIPDTVTIIEYLAFESCSNLTSVTIPASVRRIGDSAFESCSKLSNVSLLSSDIHMDPSVFSSCDELKSAGPIGSGCDYQFAWTTEIPDYAFNGCSGLMSISLPSSITKIGDSAFQSCFSLTGLSIPSGVSSIGSYAFEDCKKLSSVILPPDLERIDAGLFWRCTALTSIDLPDGVTSIGPEAFQYCSSLKTIEIPASVTSVDRAAFDECTAFSDVYYQGTHEQWAEISIIEDGNSALLNATIHFLAEEDGYSITLDPAITGGSVSVTNSAGEEISTAKAGETVVVRCVPDSGYAFHSVEAENGELGLCALLLQTGEGEYTFEMPDYDVVVHAAFIKNGVDNIGYKYTIIFNKNASKASGTMAKQTGKVTSAKTLPANAFKLSGKSFAGWNTKADGSGTAYGNKAPVSGIITRDGQKITLYAQWVTTTYTITYNANGGSSAPAAQTKEYGKSITLSGAAPERAGYTFKGWATSRKAADAGTVKYKPGAAYKSNAKLSLFAVWKPLSCELIFDGNGVTKGKSETRQTITFNKAFTMPGSGFTKSGYALKGWSLEKHAAAVDYQTNVLYAAGKKLSAADCASFFASQGYSGSVRLYAVWGPVEYKISYTFVPASAAARVTSSNAAKYNTYQGISFADAAADGYDFVGFFSDSKCTKPVVGYPAGTTGGKTVYVKFAPHSYTIRFDPNGGTASKPMKDITCSVGKSYTLSAFAFTPPKGYHFAHWEYGEGKTLKNKASAKDLSLTDEAVVTLKAIYAPNTYTIVLNANGGKFTNGKATSNIAGVKYDTDAALPGAEKLKPRSGYTFVGWNTKADCTGEDLADSAKNLVAKNSGSITLYAVWEYQVKLDGNGGKCENGLEVSFLKLKYNNTYKPTDEGFAKQGATFRGWATSAGNANASKPTLKSTLKNLKPDSVLYASWKDLYTGITITFHSNDEANNETQKTLNGSDLLPTPSSLGWSKEYFVGWSFDSNGEGNIFTDENLVADVIQVSNICIDLYAQEWVNEYVWFPAPVMSLSQIAYESYSHSGLNAIDIVPVGDVFAPFTGKIVYADTAWGFVIMISTDDRGMPQKVHYADGSFDYMSVAFMHDENIDDLVQLKASNAVIKQGEPFYQAGGMGGGDPDAYNDHVDLSVYKGIVETPPAGLGNGTVFAFDAFYINTAKTPTIYQKGRVEAGNVVTNNAPTDYNDLWVYLPK